MADFYNRERRVLLVKQKFKKFCPNCFKIVEKFEHVLKLNSYSTGRIEKYWSSLKAVHSLLG